MAAFDEGKSWIAIIVGFFFLALGGIPLMNKLGWLGFNFPEFVLKNLDVIAVWAIAGGALILFFDAALWEGFSDAIQAITIIVAIIFLGAGVVQILSHFGVIGFSIPFLKGVVTQALLIVEGLFLVIAAFAMD
jgi:hypothetical protein